MQQAYLAYIAGSKSVSMKRPVIGRRSRYVHVSNFKNNCSDFRIFCLFPSFLEQGIQLFCGVLGSTHPQTRVHYYSLTYFLEKWALLTLGHMSIIILFFMPFLFLRGGFF
jgi:hypothetical protein